MKTKHRKKHVTFNPDRLYIQDAIARYLQQGGKIEKVQPDENYFDRYMQIITNQSDVDEFLRGV